MDKNDFAVWIENEYLKWQLRQKGRKSIAEFSDWLGFPKTTVVQWMNGQRKPGAENADRISIKLNYDLTIYELLGLPVPEKRLLEFKSMYPTLTDEDVADLDKFLEKVKKRHAAEKKHDVPKTGTIDPNGDLAHAVAERLESDLLSARLTTRRARRHFVEALSNVIIIIGGIADPVLNVTRGLTIWSMLVLGAGASIMVLIRAYMVGLLGEQLLLAGVFTTVLIAMLIGLRTTTAAWRARITVQRLQIPDWLTEEV